MGYLPEIEPHFLDARTYHFDATQVSRAEPDILGEAQRAVAGLKGRATAIGHGIESHNRGTNRVDIDGIGPGHDHTGLRRTRALHPGAFPAGHRVDALDDGQMNRPRGNEVDDGARNAIPALARRVR